MKITKPELTEAKAKVNVEAEVMLRELLWIRHGCELFTLYGDDGEMQCHKCGIDFKRDTPEQIKNRFIDINKPHIVEFFKKLNLAT